MRSCAHKPTVYTLPLNLRSENDKVHKVEKVTKINARIISKPHAHLQTMEKTCAKFQKDQYKIVWGVVLTRYQLSVHWGRKMTKFTKWKKVTKNNLTNISKPHAHASYHDENTCKVSRQSVHNCKRNCTHKTPKVNVDSQDTQGKCWRMDERTNGQKLARLSRPC